jgi:hypothetical protein
VGNLTFVIDRGTPTILAAPTARLYLDETLGTAYSSLTGGLAEPTGVFEFLDPSNSFNQIGAQSVQLLFTPFDIANWKTATVNSTVTVDPLPNYGNLSVSLDFDQLNEGDVNSSVTVFIRRPNNPNNSTLPATINLHESIQGQLQADPSGEEIFVDLPSQITIPAGANFTVAYLKAKNDATHIGNRTVSLLVSSRFHGSTPQTVVLNVIEDDPQLAGFAAWSNNAPPTPELIRDYAIGGAPFGQSGPLPTLSNNSTHIALDAIVRSQDPKLSVVGEWTSDLMNGPWTPINLSLHSNQAGLFTGFERKFFSVPLQNGETKKFLRLRIQLQP